MTEAGRKREKRGGMKMGEGRRKGDEERIKENEGWRMEDDALNEKWRCRQESS